MEIEITKEDFDAYEEVRQSGVTNMFDVTAVSNLSGLNRKQIIHIMSNYDSLSEEYDIS